MSRKVKQVIVWRGDLKEMPLGKKMAQAGHAAHQFLTENIKPVPDQIGPDSFRSYPSMQTVSLEIDAEAATWILGDYKKAVLLVRTEAELQTIYSKARELGLRAHIVTDLGHTVFDGEPTVTCLAIGPNYEEEIDKVTGESGPLGKLRLV